MPFIDIAESPLSPDAHPVSIYYRTAGTGFPLVFLHGGWGYEIYPFDQQISEFGDRFGIVIPDRTGYGRSSRIDRLPIDFHSRAAAETISFLDALGLDRPVLWGHSDGAVIAAKVALLNPDRVSAVVLEAFHFLRKKPGSTPFFEVMAGDPYSLGERVTTVLARDHGDDYWQKIILLNGRGWLGLANEAKSDDEDLYDGQLSKLRVPTLFIHGSRDPRTEPGELDAVKSELTSAKFEIIDGGGHSPHSSTSTGQDCNRAASTFFSSIL